MSDIVPMQLVGINVVLVHGGGPEISSMLKKIGKESRLSTECAIRTAKPWILCRWCWQVRSTVLVQLLEQHSGRAVGLCGLDGKMILAEKMASTEDLGYVGEITEVNTQIIKDTTDRAISQSWRPWAAATAGDSQHQCGYRRCPHCGGARRAEADPDDRYPRPAPR